jgi:hypothetical protein
MFDDREIRIAVLTVELLYCPQRINYINSSLYAVAAAAAAAGATDRRSQLSQYC